MSIFHVRSIEEIDEICPTDMDIILKMLQDRLLPRNPVCLNCGVSMVLRQNANRIEWQCTPHEACNPCPPRSVREGSWFEEHATLSLRTILKIIVLYGKGLCDLEIREILVLPKGTLGELRRRLEGLCTSIVDSYGPLGGANATIELRETTFTCRRPADTSRISALVGVDLTSGRCFAQELRENTVTDVIRVLKRWVRPDTFNEFTDFRQMGGAAVEEFINRFKVPILRSEQDLSIQGYLNEVVVRCSSGRNFARELFYQMQVLKRPAPPPVASKTSPLLREALSAIFHDGTVPQPSTSQLLAPFDGFYQAIRGSPAGSRKRAADENILQKINDCGDFFKSEEVVVKEEVMDPVFDQIQDEDGAISAVSLLSEGGDFEGEKTPKGTKRVRRLTGRNAVARRLSAQNNTSPVAALLFPDTSIQMPPKIHLSELTSTEQLDELCQTELDLAILMMEQNFLPRDPPCFNCGKIMTLRLRGKNSDTTAEWRCRDGKNRRDCSSRSVRTGSWFASSAMPLKAMIKMLFLWYKGITPSAASTALKISLSTIISYREMFKDVCSRILATYEPLGGPDSTVQVAQYPVVTRKFGRGQRVAEPNNVILGIDTATGRCFMELESSGNEEKILGALKKWIKIGTIVNGIPFDGVVVPSMGGGFETQKILEAVLPNNHSNMTTNTLPGYLAEMVARLNEGDDFLRKVMALMSCGSTGALPPMDRASYRRQNDELMKNLEQLISGMPKEEPPEEEVPSTTATEEEKPEEVTPAVVISEEKQDDMLST